MVCDTSLLVRVDLASSKILRFIDFKESDEAICERGNHIRFKLVHSNSHTFFFRYNELELELTVKHIPKFNDTILTTTGDHIILVELVEFILFLIDLKLRWWDILEVYTVYLVLRVMARF